MENHLQTFSDSPVSFNMIAIEGNSNGDPFKMSDTYRVRLDDFWMGEYPVTQALWAYVMSDTDIADPSYFKGINQPVEKISWNDIVSEFLPRLNKLTESSCPANTQYRLPTGIEWEYAAKGGKYWKKYPFEYAGSDKLDEIGWHNENSHSEQKDVGLKTPNLLGLYDMIGNVFEWCNLPDSPYYDAVTGRFIEHPSKKKMSRVIMGGSWNWMNKQSFRSTWPPGSNERIVGFRLVLSFSPVQ